MAAVLELTGSSRTTVMVVSAGTTNGLGATASRGADLPDEFLAFVDELEELFEESLEELLAAASGAAA